MSRRFLRARARIAVVLAATTVAVGATATTATAHDGTHESAAYGWYLSLHNINNGPIGTTHYPEGPAHASFLDTHHDLVIIGAGETNSGGNPSTGDAWADASLTKLGLDLFYILPTLPTPRLASIVGDTLRAECRATTADVTGTSSIGSLRISILGKPVTLPATPPPNFKVSVPGLIDITLNKQVRNANGSLTVTALAVESTALFETLVQGNVDGLFASTTCGAEVSGGEGVPGGHEH